MYRSEGDNYIMLLLDKVLVAEEAATSKTSTGVGRLQLTQGVSLCMTMYLPVYSY